MAISGSLETFSLPELFQIIASGRKSGRLKFTPVSKNKDPNLKGIFEIWFDQGNFVAIVNSLEYQFLIAEIQNNAWIDTRHLVRSKYSYSTVDQAFGTYLIEQNLLTESQIDLLFKTQVNELIKLFNINSAWFKFEDLNNNNKIPNDGETFPWKEMTGRHKKATEVSLEAMRNLSDWSRFAEDIPPHDCGLQRLVENHDLKLNSLEQHLWNTADGSLSLKKISQDMGISSENVQQAALSMIFAGLVEEVPVMSPAIKMATVSQLSKTPAFAGQNNTLTKVGGNKPNIGNSLIGNLVSFLRNNF